MPAHLLFQPLSSPDTLSGLQVFNINANMLREVLGDCPQGRSNPVLHINLPDGSVHPLHAVSMESTGKNSRAWYGVNPDNPSVYAFLGVADAGENGLYLAGTVFRNNQYHILQPAGPGLVQITSATDCNGVACSCPPIIQPTGGPTVKEGTSWSEADLPDTAVIDILALYPSAVKTKVKGGEHGITAIVASMQIATNAHFQNSGISARVNVQSLEMATLKHTDVAGLHKEVVYSEEIYSGDGSNAVGINFVRGPAYDAVSSIRDAMAADVVALLATEPSTSMVIMGQSNCIPQPARADRSGLEYATFSSLILAIPEMPPGSPQQIFAHEFGHLLGGQHSRKTQPEIVGDPLYDFARGYVSPDGSHGTAMSYSGDFAKGGTYIPAYSTTDHTWQGKPLGITIEHPDAADCASLFRISTHAVSRYRGKQHPHPGVDFRPEPAPATGGYLVPATSGPYAVGSTVTVTAFPHQGYIFERWELNDEPVTADRTIQITITERENRLQALFRIQPEAWHTVTIKSPPAGTRIELDPPGGHYPWGTTVRARYIPSSIPDYAKWKNYSLLTGNKLAMEESFLLGVTQNCEIAVMPHSKSTEFSHFSAAFTSDRALATETKGQYSWIIYDYVNRLGPDAGREVRFSIDPSSTVTDVRLLNTHAVSDSRGLARVEFLTGKQTGSLVINAVLEKTVGEEVSRESKSNPVQVWDAEHPIPETMATIIAQSDWNQSCTVDQAPRPVSLQFLKAGKPQAGFRPTLKLDSGTTGIRLVHSDIVTDQQGCAQLTFTPPDQEGIAMLDLGQGYKVWVKVFPANMVAGLSIPQAGRSVKAGELPPPIPIALPALIKDLSRYDNELEPLSDIEIQLELKDGGTGVKLFQDKVSFTGFGKGWIWLHPATRVGKATLLLRMKPYTSSLALDIDIT